MSNVDWVIKIANQVEAHVRRTKGEGATIVCASGISPSGPIHLGNLREVMTVHLVSEELRHRGWQVDHLHSWDDFDRLRKVPAGVSPDFQQYIGAPLAEIPDPFGEYDSYATRYITDFTQALEQLGVRPRYIRQSRAYRAGQYVEQIKRAMARRLEIFDILAEYQTLRADTVAERRSEYYPFRVYCQHCHRDTTRITSYDEATARIDYTCDSCEYSGSFSLDERVEGKLVWKVDWPMRWSYERVDFEPAGEDHAAPGSSFVVGQRIVQGIYEAPAPQFARYAFVGMEGRTKISSSVGTTATVSSALTIIEPCILRWLYARRSNSQAFNIDYGQGLLRLYDEWDALERQIVAGKASETNQLAYNRSIKTTAGLVERTPLTAPFSLLTSVIDVTQGNMEQTLRIISQHLANGYSPEMLRGLLEPRLTCAMNWVTNYQPEDERTTIRDSFDAIAYEQFGEQERAGIRLLVERLDDAWSLEALTRLLYDIPKLVRGLPLDTQPDNALKQAQRSFFIALYTLLCGRDTGPRLPTLLLSLGRERVKCLLAPNGKAAIA
ncbi:MAG TPA: lysine--tRNA ligase [Ktedonosporobacter sp.]|nr:lysine--tRNA ligase [Ktedonosporobacter sp.]